MTRKSKRPYELLIVTMPPQHGKSMTISESLPAWYLLHNPHGRVLEVCYSETFASLFGRRNRQKIDEFGPRLGGLRTASDNRSAQDFTLQNGVGGMISRGVFSGITGRAADLVIIDDPVKNMREALSSSHRETLWEVWQSSIKTRLSSGARVILIMTRWHEDDLAGRMLMREKNAQSISLACEADTDDPLGRAQGDPLFPEIGKDKAWLTTVKQSYIHDAGLGGLRAWEALYQGHPSPKSGDLVRREWWRFYRVAPVNAGDERLPTTFDHCVQSWDCSFKGTSGSDFVCGGVWGFKDGGFYLLDMVHRRMSFVETIRAIRNISAKWPAATLKYIEDKANGSAVIDLLSRSLPGVVPVTPQGGKVARVQAITPLLEAGNVLIPHPDEAPWTATLLSEFDRFPHGAHDDIVDMTSQALYKLMQYSVNDKTLHGDYLPDELSDLRKSGMITAQQLSAYKRRM